MTCSAKLKLVCIAFLTLATTSVSAADLKEVYELAVNNDPELARAKANFMASSESYVQGRAGLLPEIVVQGSTSNNSRTTLLPEPAKTIDYNDNGWQATLTQPLFRLDRWFQFQKSKETKARAMADFSTAQQALIFRVADSYLKILEAQDRLSAANAARDAVQRQLEQVRQRFDVGLVAITDVLESTAAFDSSTVDVIEAEGAQVVTFETLLRLTGQPFTEVNGISEEFPVEYPNPRDEEAWVNAALKGNFELVSARATVESARRDMQIARSAHMPSVNAQISYAESASGGGGFFGSEIEQTTASLRFNVPVFAGGGTQSGARQAGYGLEASQRTLDLTQRQVVENTRNLYSQINTDVARVRARLRGIESSQSALDATQTGYEVGTRNIVDVLQAQQRLFQAQFQYASARYQYIRDTLQLKQVVGSLSPDDIYQLNQFIMAGRPVGKITPTTQ